MKLTQDTDSAQGLPLLIRKCRKCTDGQMHITAVRQSGAEQTQTFECQNCDARLEIASAGYIGLQFWVWLIVSVFLIWLFLIDDLYTSTTTYVVVLGFVALGGYWSLEGVLAHFRHPLINGRDATTQPRPSGQAPPSFIAKVLNLGFVKTPLIFLCAAVAFLGLAALVGYIKDYVL